jgi:type I restriction enzyme S subunit
VDWGNTDLTKAAYVEGGRYLAVSAAGCDGRIGHKEHTKHTPVLSAIGAQCGRMFLPEEDFTAIKNTITLTPRDGTCTGKFLYQLLTHVELPKRGAAQPFISKGDIQTFQVPVPTLPEQQRIVSLLDEAFAGIATAKANAEKNLQNARALFESHLQSVFTQRGEGWVETTIGDQLTLQRGFDITKRHQNEGDVPVVSSGGIKSYHDKAMAGAPGVVIGRKGTLGKVFYIEKDYWPHDTTLWVKDFKGNEPRFVYYLFAVLDVKKFDSGTANPALNRNQVHPLPVTWPPVAHQKKIIAKLDSLHQQTQRLAGIYERKLAALEALKKSLLHLAFSGEL